MKAQEVEKRVLEVVTNLLSDPEWVHGVIMDGYPEKYFPKFNKAAGKIATRLFKVLARTTVKLEKIHAD